MSRRLSQNFISVFVFVFFAVFVGHTPLFAQQTAPLRIVTAQGMAHDFQVEVVDDDEARQRGLMFRQHMPADQGMLFDFQEVRPILMWMKNTYLSLDMVFIRADGSIARVVEKTEPLSTKTIPSGEPVLSVLELVGGTCSRLGIKAGDRVEHPLFGK